MGCLNCKWQQDRCISVNAFKMVDCILSIECTVNLTQVIWFQTEQNHMRSIRTHNIVSKTVMHRHLMIHHCFCALRHFQRLIHLKKGLSVISSNEQDKKRAFHILSDSALRKVYRQPTFATVSRQTSCISSKHWTLPWKALYWSSWWVAGQISGCSYLSLHHQSFHE